MKRRILLFLLAACLGLTACQAAGVPGEQPTPQSSDVPSPSTNAPEPFSTETPTEQSVTEPAPTEEPTPVLPEIPPEQGRGFTALDNGLIEYLCNTKLGSESFTVSPLSYKAALALTALGAEGETQRQILDALGFETVEELNAWYASVLVGVADFDGRIYGRDKADCAYRVVNAIFHNSDCDGAFREEYKELVARTLAAQASSFPAAELTGAINRWVSDQTNGLIPNLVQDASKSASVLVNALYLKTKWIEAFEESPLTVFTTLTGKTVQKQFIQKTDKFAYYEDEGCQLVVLPMQGGINMALILGDGGNLPAKLAAAQNRKVHGSMPMFEVETSLEEKELVDYLKAIGCGKMFVDSVAEFDPMFTQGIYVSDIIQKARVKVDEKGLEAAAATAVIMMRNTAMPNPEEPVEFTADRPFQFAIYRQDEAPELLFWGQVNN